MSVKLEQWVMVGLTTVSALIGILTFAFSTITYNRSEIIEMSERLTRIETKVEYLVEEIKEDDERSRNHPTPVHNAVDERGFTTN